MKNKEIRLLTADEIECRVGTISEKGLSLLLYKDARADMKILDEVFGRNNWQRIHEMIGGNLYCNVQIYDEEKQQWISKMDVGTESFTEKEKGQASDSFKRACGSVGIGRELYTAPFIWISRNKVDIVKKGDRYITFEKFKVKNIAYNEQREIIEVVITNQNGNIVYSYAQKEETKREKTRKARLSNEQMEQMNSELQRTGVALDTVLSRYNIKNIEEMSEAVYTKAMQGLKKSKGKAA